MMNSIRFQTTASLRTIGEAREAQSFLSKGGQKTRQFPVLTARARQELSGMVGGRMVGSCCDVKRGSRPEGGAEFMAKGSEEPRLGGDRALVVAKKSRNWDGVKGGRKAMAGGDKKPERKATKCPKGLIMTRHKASGRKRNQSDHALCNGEEQQKSISNSKLTRRSRCNPIANWRAGCEKFARPVRRGGRFKPVPTSIS